MVVLELEAVYAQAAPHTKLLNKRFVGAHHWLGPLKEALVARLAADKVRIRFTAIAILAPRYPENSTFKFSVSHLTNAPNIGIKSHI